MEGTEIMEMDSISSHTIDFIGESICDDILLSVLSMFMKLNLTSIFYRAKVIVVTDIYAFLGTDYSPRRGKAFIIELL